MRVCVFASSSSGNCLLLQSGDTNILIDAGISMRRTVSALSHAGLNLRDIGGVLITHEHSDHIYGLKMLLKHNPMPVYAPRTLAARLVGILPESEKYIQIIPLERPFSIGGLEIFAYPTPHDVDQSVCYRVESGEGCFALATDMGCVTENVLHCLSGADTVLIESNHDEEMLRYGPYPVYLKRRVLSDRGHLSNDNCAMLAAKLAEGGTKRFILGHLSQENNRPEIAFACAQKALGGRFVELVCAPVYGFLEVQVNAER